MPDTKPGPVRGSHVIWEPKGPLAERVLHGPEMDKATNVAALLTALAITALIAARGVGVGWRRAFTLFGIAVTWQVTIPFIIVALALAVLLAGLATALLTARREAREEG